MAFDWSVGVKGHIMTSHEPSSHDSKQRPNIALSQVFMLMEQRSNSQCYPFRILWLFCLLNFNLSFRLTQADIEWLHSNMFDFFTDTVQYVLFMSQICYCKILRLNIHIHNVKAIITTGDRQMHIMHLTSISIFLSLGSTSDIICRF